MRSSIIAVLFLAITTSATFADGPDKAGSNNGPPAGIAPVTIKLQTVLDNFDEAIGRQSHRSITEVETGTLSEYGMSGKFRDVYAGLHSGDDFKHTETVGPFTDSFGRYQGQRWRQNENGITNVLQDTVRADEEDESTFIDDTENPKNDVSMLGEVTSPIDAYVVQVAKKLFGDTYYSWLYFDVKTGFLDRVDIGGDDDRTVVTYDDYRTANGVAEPWHTHFSDNNPANATDERVTATTFGTTATNDDLSIPPTRQNFVQFPAGAAEVDMPSDISVSDLEYLNISFADPLVRITINGRGLDFLLNSTANDMEIDYSVAKQLGLSEYGPYETDGSLTYPTRAIVPSMSIGTLGLKNVNVTVTQMSDYENTGQKAVGVIGYDFLANAVVEIDYVHNVVKAYDPAQFIPPSDSQATPTNIDDGIPFVSAQIGQSDGDYFLLDTSAPATLLDPAFWQAHPADVQDQGVGRGYSGLFRGTSIKPTQLKTLIFGGVQFQEFVAYESTDGSADEGVENDGVLGYDFLQFFNVYFDYPQHMIYLELNDNFYKSKHH